MIFVLSDLSKQKETSNFINGWFNAPDLKNNSQKQ
jgi:hypothetical protein